MHHPMNAYSKTAILYLRGRVILKWPNQSLYKTHGSIFKHLGKVQIIFKFILQQGDTDDTDTD